MTGAIEFMKAWRNICVEPKSCEDCPLTTCRECNDAIPLMASDEIITELVRQVMTESRKKVDNE